MTCPDLLHTLRFTMSRTNRVPLAALLALFVGWQLVLAVQALTGQHSHAWDLHTGGACWMCLTVSLSAAGTVLGFARAL